MWDVLLIISMRTTHIGECVIIVKMHQVEHNIGMNGDFKFNMDNSRKSSTLSFQIKLYHKRLRGPNKNKALHLHHILFNRVEKTNVGGVINFIEKKIHIPTQAAISNLNPN